MNGIQDQIFVMHVQKEQFIFHFMNQAVINERGFPLSDIGKSLEEVLKKEEVNRIKPYYIETLEKQIPISYEDEYYSINGDKKYAEVVLTPVYIEESNEQYIVAAINDVTKEKQTEWQMKEVWQELNRSKKKYQSLFRHNSDAIISFDLDGHILNGNPATEHLTGYKPVELIGLTIHQLVDESTVEVVQNLFMHAFSGTTDDTSFTIIRKDNSLKDVSLKVTPLIVDSEVRGIYGIFRDITSVVQSQKKLEESEERFRIIAENAFDLITLLDNQGKIIYASPSYKKIIGFDYKEYVGKLFLHHIHPEDRGHMSEIVIESMQNSDNFSMQCRHYTKDRDYIWLEANGTPVFDENKNLKHMVVLARDISMQKEYEEKLEFYALHDFMTGLPNRRLFKQKLNESLKNHNKNNYLLAVMMLDIDNFKSINDTFGHDIGDEVIIGFGQIIKEVIGEKDMVARLGGDEFTLMLTNCSTKQDVGKIAQAIKKKMQENNLVHDSNYSVTTSIGITFLKEKEATRSAFKLMKEADLALYETKKHGKDGFCFYHVNLLEEDVSK